MVLNLSLYGQTKDWNTFKKDSYTIDYPKDWELDESGQMGTSFILFSPLTSQKDQFRENVNLLVQDLTGYNLDLDKYVEISEEQVKTLITDGKIIESKYDLASKFEPVKFVVKPLKDNNEKGDSNAKPKKPIDQKW